MSFASFCMAVTKYQQKAGIPFPARFSTDPETGRHLARFPGVSIIGNEMTQNLAVRWGSGHKAFFTPEAD